MSLSGTCAPFLSMSPLAPPLFPFLQKGYSSCPSWEACGFAFPGRDRRGLPGRVIRRHTPKGFLGFPAGFLGVGLDVFPGETRGACTNPKVLPKNLVSPPLSLQEIHVFFLQTLYVPPEQNIAGLTGFLGGDVAWLIGFPYMLRHTPWHP